MMQQEQMAKNGHPFPSFAVTNDRRVVETTMEIPAVPDAPARPARPHTVTRHRDPGYLNDLRAFREGIVIFVLAVVLVNIIAADVLLWSYIHNLGR